MSSWSDTAFEVYQRSAKHAALAKEAGLRAPWEPSLFHPDLVAPDIPVSGRDNEWWKVLNPLTHRLLVGGCESSALLVSLGFYRSSGLTEASLQRCWHTFLAENLAENPKSLQAIFPYIAMPSLIHEDFKTRFFIMTDLMELMQNGAMNSGSNCGPLPVVVLDYSSTFQDLTSLVDDAMNLGWLNVSNLSNSSETNGLIGVTWPDTKQIGFNQFEAQIRSFARRFFTLDFSESIQSNTAVAAVLKKESQETTDRLRRATGWLSSFVSHGMESVVSIPGWLPPDGGIETGRLVIYFRKGKWFNGSKPDNARELIHQLKAAVQAYWASSGIFLGQAQRNRVLAKMKSEIAAKAALFSRNFSHNIGSHALSHPGFADALGIGDEKKDAKANAKHFFHFLQHRYDWISQMVSGYAGGQSQPMLLMAEVLLPFFRQTALLTKLVADQDIAELEFEALHPGALGSQSFAIKEQSDDLTAIHEDCYIAVPGGIVGCQALYSIIENFMRNSAKYAQRKLDKAKKMCIYLDLMEHAGEYQFQICDTAANGPKDTQTSLTDQINRVTAFSKQPLIGKDGSLVAEGRGILDMRESAKSLHPESTFETLEVNSTLAHRFSIQKPNLVSVLTKNKPTHEARLSLCQITSDPTTWLAKAPALAVVDDNGRFEPSEISKLQLPYRILVICDESRMAIWREKLPLRAQIISGSLPAMDDENTAMLRLYETWLLAAKPPPNQSRWQLAIGIERPHTTIKERWSRASDFKSEFVDLWVYSKQPNEEARAVDPENGGGWATVKEQAKSNEFFKGAQWKSWLIFDNHGNCFQPSERSLLELTPPEFPGFYSEIGGGQSSLWNRLYRPPVEPFSFAWFILSLVESATTRVLVVDERVLSFADSKLENYQALMRGGVMPIREISGSQTHLVLPIHAYTPDTRVDQQGVFSDLGSELLVDFDMFVIHESIAQRLATPNFAEWAKAIKQHVRWLVNSSGRGEGRSLLFGGEPLPFVGFAALAQSAYADQNKLDLVSALASSHLPPQK